MNQLDFIPDPDGRKPFDCTEEEMQQAGEDWRKRLTENPAYVNAEREIAFIVAVPRTSIRSRKRARKAQRMRLRRRLCVFSRHLTVLPRGYEGVYENTIHYLADGNEVKPA